MELVTSSKGAVKERSKPTLIALENGQYAVSSGRWSDDAMVDYIVQEARDKYVTLGALAKVAYRRNCLETKRKVRAYLRRVCDLIETRFGLFVVFNPNTAKGPAIKIMDAQSTPDCQLFLEDWKRRRARNEISEARYERACSILASLTKKEAA